jgi:hypothetical protein
MGGWLPLGFAPQNKSPNKQVFKRNNRTLCLKNVECFNVKIFNLNFQFIA